MIYTFGDCRIDTDLFELSRNGAGVPVQPQVLELLIMLIDNRDHVVSKDELLRTIWKGRIVSETALSSRIKSARQMIGDDGKSQAYIKTIHGRGFRFVGSVDTQTAPPGPAALERPATLYARSGETHVAYHLFGHGPVNLIITPGFVSHIDNYWDDPHLAAWLGRLGKHARVAIFDKRGTGMSDRVTDLPGMDERMDDVRAVLDASGFESAFIMGISEGGSLAAMFAAHQPARCDGLILYGSFERFDRWFPDDQSLRALFEYIENSWGSGRSLPQFAPSMAGDQAYIDWWGRFERLGATPGGAIALMTMNSRIDISDILSSVQAPTLVIHRADDVLIDVEGSRYLASHIKGASYLELEGRDHLPWVGANADQIADAITAFLRDTTEPSVPERKLATILLLDIDANTVGRLAAGESSPVSTELRRFRATHQKVMSGGIAAAFDGPARALACAVSIGALMRRQDVDFRIAMHTGEIVLSANDLEGTAVDVAADVLHHADRREILVSRTVNDLVAGCGILLEDRGAASLPTIDQDWQLYRVAPGDEE